MSNLPAVVTILDLPLATTLSSAAMFEAVQTTAAGVPESVRVGVSQLMTSSLGALPTGGGTGQVLGKSSGADFAASWVDPSSFVGANATSGLAVTGSTSLALALASSVGLSVLGVSGAATAIATALVGTTTQIFGINTSTAGFFAATSLMPGPFKTATLGAFGVVIAQGASPLQVAAPSTAGNVLIDQGAAANPAFKVVSGDITITANGTVAIGSNVVSYAKIQAGTGLAVLGFATTASSNVTTFLASAANQVLQVSTTGSTVGWGLPAQVLLNTISPNGVATCGDTTSLTSTFKSYLVTLANVIPSAATAVLQLQIATTGTAFVTGGYVSNAGILISAVATVVVDQSTNVVLLSGSRATTAVGSSAGVGVSGFVRMFDPANATARKMWMGEISYYGPASFPVLVAPAGYFDANTAITGFQVSFSTGTISTGTIKVYGLT